MCKIKLRPCPKQYIRETHRQKPPDVTLQSIERLKDALDILSLNEATGFDRIGLPVFTCERMRPDGSTTWHTGKGVLPAQAQVSLMMEAAERYASEFRSEYTSRLIRGSYGSLRLRFNVLDPHDLILPSFSNTTDDTELYWTWGYNLLAEEKILVPAQAVYHPFPLDTATLIKTHTNGIAAGNTLEEAIFHAIMEIIERDAWSIALFNLDYGLAIFLDEQSQCNFLSEILDRFAAAQIGVIVRDISSDLGIPVIAAFSEDLVHPSLKRFDGFGAHLDPHAAAARALLEVATTRALFIQRFGLENLKENVPYYYSEMDLADPIFERELQQPLSALTMHYHNDITHDIKALLELLRERNFQKVIVIDLTRHDLDIPTVRVIIPGMEVYCFDKERRGDRLYNF